ncbi:porin [Burkholderia oklahomensis]|uniref:Gram-negative porin family protein n=1 Tax=Burkholderia oklahomensis TaxID=342113 RepID=A0AAI8B7G5_9BURK|nr:porin [Burkholderia oklahomensis]AIO66966.1 gram-negative porin family protein [Burkholderia oklahomensis]AOI43044.1 porin [Burkholderia oklahomensis EO147]KUY57936.1 porin [Burkholderia oklahomensis EO147]QPS37782.1 porin [Burkholderia oklahomensis]
MKYRRLDGFARAGRYAALCVGFGCGAAASAQSSVTLYGLLDAGFQYKTHASASGDGAFSSNNANTSYPSRFGLRGSEDLGGGYRAIFQLENGFSLSSGAFAAAGTPFNRTALVGLTSDRFGSLTFGRQYSVQYDKTVLYEPTLFNNYSIFSLNMIPPATVRLDNSIKYVSPDLAGVNVEAMYGFGQQLPGNEDAGRYWGVAVEYKHGEFWARAGYEEVRGTVSDALDRSGAADRRASVVVRYAFDRFTVSSGVETVRGSLQASPNGDIYWAAGQYMPTPALKLIVEGGRYVFKGSGGRPTLVNASVLYWLSKRTTVYVTAGYTINGGGSDFGVNNYTTTPAPGMTQLAAGTGLIVRF